MRPTSEAFVVRYFHDKQLHQIFVAIFSCFADILFFCLARHSRPKEKQAEKIERSSLPIGAFIVSAGQDLLPRFSRIAQQCTLHYSALR